MKNIMNESAFRVLFFIFIIPLVYGFGLRHVTEDYEDYDYENIWDWELGRAVSEVNSSIFRTVHKYRCHFQYIESPELLVYAAKAWEFPRQSTNLTLSYPSVNSKQWYVDDWYTITGFDVTLFVDTTETQGFITSGGILQNSINLNFTCNDVTTLAYEFWVYGVRRDAPRVLDALSGSAEQNNLC